MWAHAHIKYVLNWIENWWVGGRDIESHSCQQVRRVGGHVGFDVEPTATVDFEFTLKRRLKLLKVQGAADNIESCAWSSGELEGW